MRIKMKYKIGEEKGSMAVYVSVVLISMLLILTAVLLISNSVRKSQLETIIGIKQTYEADNSRADEIYKKLADTSSGNIGTEDDDLEGYVTNGLLLLYDGINNTGNGHSNTATTWKDLSGNGNDITLNNIKINEDNSLSAIDNTSYAVRDVTIPASNTIEVVAQYNTTDIGYLYALEKDDSHYFYLWNYSGSGSTLSYRYVNNGTWDVFDNITDETSILNKKIFISITFDANTNNANIYVDGQYHKTLNFPKPEAEPNTRLRLFNTINGGRPLIGGAIYSVRAYDRILTESEILQNYQQDMSKYGS